MPAGGFDVDQKRKRGCLQLGKGAGDYPHRMAVSAAFAGLLM